MIQGVDEVRAELQVHSFRKVEKSRYRKVILLQTGIPYITVARSSKTPLGRRSKRGLIEPAVWPGIGKQSGPSEIVCLPASREHRRIPHYFVCEPRLQMDNSSELPVTKRSTNQGWRISQPREIPDKASREHVRGIVRKGPVHPVEVVVILVVLRVRRGIAEDFGERVGRSKGNITCTPGKLDLERMVVRGGRAHELLNYRIAGIVSQSVNVSGRTRSAERGKSRLVHVRLDQ